MEKSGFIYKQIKKYNIILLIFTLLLVYFEFFIVIDQKNYIHNLTSGPFVTSEEKLDSMKKSGSLKEYYVKVKGENVYTFLKDDGYLLLEMNNAILAITGNADENKLEFTGTLNRYTLGDKQKLVAALNSHVSDLKDIHKPIYPLILNTDGNLITGNLYLIIIFGLFLVLIIRNTVLFIIRTKKPYSHPACKRLLQFGALEEMIRIVNCEVDRSEFASSKIKVFVTDSWIIDKGLFKPTFIPLSDLVWVHSKLTSYRYGFIPTGKKYELFVYTKKSERFELKIKDRWFSAELIKQVGLKAPWAFTGYSEELEDKWNYKRKELFEEVEKRYDQAREHGEETLR